jgi:cyclase
MLKQRLVGLVLVRDGIVVQSLGFRRWLPIGIPEIAIEFLERWGVDEIVLLHIDAWRTGIGPTASQVTAYARHCQVPLTVGGGLRSVEDIRRVIQSGADKVALNSAAFETPALIGAAAQQFGEQCIVISIDARRDTVDGKAWSFTHGGSRNTGLTVVEAAKYAESQGAGEVLVTSIDRDGALSGYDLPLLSDVLASTKIPVIAAGGAGSADDLVAAARAGVAAFAVGNRLHFVEHSVILLKRHLQETGVSIRLDSYANYAGHKIPSSGRLTSLDEIALENLRFRYIPEESI